MTTPGALAPPRAEPRRSGRVPEIDLQRCTGCGRCVGACGLHLLSLEVRHWRKSAVLHDAPRCTGCNACAAVCPFDAVRLRRPPAPAPASDGDTPGAAAA